MRLIRLLALMLLAAVLAAWPAAAQERRVPTSPAEVKLSYAPVVQKAAPAVVNVYAAKVVENRNPFIDDPFFRRFFGGEGGLPRERLQSSLGSGVIVDAGGLVVTNNHVIEGADEVKVALADKREFEAEIVLKDARTDLAVLRIKDSRERFPVIEFGDSDGLQVGDLVLAIGNPFAVGQTVTHGIVSAVARTQVGITDYQFFIQTDAAINPGNSGGALVDLSGRLVGINTAIFSRSGGSQGIGFAIPVNMVRVVVASALGGGSSVKRPWLGAKLQAVTPEIAESLGLKRPAGALVASVTANSPAAQGRPAHRRPDRRHRRPAGRRSQRLRLPLRHQAARRPGAGEGHARRQGGAAADRAADRARHAARGDGDQRRSPFLGAKVGNLSPALAEELRLDTGTQGVVILDVAVGSPAQRLGFQRGDVINAVNGEKIGKTRDLERVAAQSTARLAHHAHARRAPASPSRLGG